MKKLIALGLAGLLYTTSCGDKSTNYKFLDCNDLTKDYSSLITDTYDHDGDGFCGVEIVQSVGVSQATLGELLQDHRFDCNDNDYRINPSAQEIPNDSIDNNCNREIDE